jgi:hypothetical protein
MSVFSLGRFANRPLIPNPFDSEDQARRFHHHDLHQLSPGELWSEVLMLEVALAARVAQRVRAQILVGWPEVIDDRAWLVARIRALRREQQRRRGRA